MFDRVFSLTLALLMLLAATAHYFLGQMVGSTLTYPQVLALYVVTTVAFLLYQYWRATPRT